MQRIDYIKDRLSNWVNYKISERGGGLGFPSRSAFLREAVSGHRETRIPVIESDGLEMDVGINAMGVVQPDLKRVLHLVYIESKTYADAAKAAGCVVRTVHDQLARADHWLDRWLIERRNKAANDKQIKKAIV